jgi:sec-independent protein translocase protein TatC
VADTISTPDSAAEGDGDLGRMTLFEHLAELRRRIIICAVAITVTTIVGWFLYNPILHFMVEPYRAYAIKHNTLSKGKLVQLGVAEGFTTRLKVSTYIGLALAAPVWLWELWRFITPGLKRNERRYAISFVASAVVLFSAGVAVAILVWPRAIDWLIGVAGSNVEPLFSPQAYINLYTLICLVFGLVFLYPIVVVFLMITGVVPTRKWRKWRRPAIVVLCAVAAVVTPSNDPFTFGAMAVPMVFLYEFSIVIGRILKK